MQGYVGEQLTVSNGLQRSTAVSAALPATVISSVDRICVILPQIMIELDTVTIPQLTVDGGDMAAQQLGNLPFAVTGTEQRFKLYATIVIKPFPSCHFQILQNQITQMTARLDSCYANGPTVRPAHGSAVGPRTCMRVDSALQRLFKSGWTDGDQSITTQTIPSAAALSG